MFVFLMLMLPGLLAAHETGESSRVIGEAWLITPLLITGLWYTLGLMRVWMRSHEGRARLTRLALLFYSGWAIIAASLLSPLHALGTRSFTAHMIEHELLMLVAAPLIALSQPMGVLLWAFPVRTRLALGALGNNSAFARAWHALSGPLTATVIQAIALWVWHVPGFFDRALASEGWHAAQHISLLGSALLFWWALTHSAKGAQGAGTSSLYLFVTSLHSGLLGALMAIAMSPWYVGYIKLGLHGPLFGMTTIEDQQLAGLIMWIPGGAVHAGAALYYLSRWFKRTHAEASAHALS